MNPSETSDGLEYELDAFQRGFAFWESPKAQYLPPIDDAGRRRYRGLCPRFPTVIMLFGNYCENGMKMAIGIM